MIIKPELNFVTKPFKYTYIDIFVSLTNKKVTHSK